MNAELRAIGWEIEVLETRIEHIRYVREIVDHNSCLLQMCGNDVESAVITTAKLAFRDIEARLQEQLAILWHKRNRLETMEPNAATD